MIVLVPASSLFLASLVKGTTVREYYNDSESKLRPLSFVILAAFPLGGGGGGGGTYPINDLVMFQFPSYNFFLTQ